ncbi:MAG TPA: hypothetical protein VNN80_19870, partial [Polyangiaceae bacterium]|nr:hypothetical protein [Polyangiaceae bacterium]
MLGTSTRQISTPRAALSLLRGGPQRPLPAHECATDDQLLAFVNGRLDRRTIERLDEHLNTCATCATLLVAALGVDDELRPGPSAFGAHSWTFAPDTWIDRRYVLRRPLGHGGMGEVYEAFDVSRARSLALKTAKATQCDRPDQERRLASELELARRAGGPHVCQVYDVGLHREP